MTVVLPIQNYALAAVASNSSVHISVYEVKNSTEVAYELNVPLGNVLFK